jgi:hypothetical protein
MLLRTESQKLELNILDYEFPEDGESYFDSDWLNVRIVAESPAGSWTAVDPALLTWEVERLIRWLEAIAQGRPVDWWECFTEPCLEFKLLDGDPLKIRVCFSHEFRPGWTRKEDIEDEEEIYLEFAVSPQVLSEAAGALRRELDEFPVRKGRQVKVEYSTSRIT